MKIDIFKYAGVFAEDKDVAARLRQDVIEKALREGKSVTLDFSRVELATQSFVHALLCDIVRKSGASILDKVRFKGCNDTLKSLITAVTEYCQEEG